ncbi:MAG: hypothetical protein IPN68_13230 [Bacteroidetes bacterium]|nr:hypothetical protein [Bacteroidota bacterium]
MRILSFLILTILNPLQERTSSPHGTDFTISCGTCHSSKGWHLDKEVYSFNHNSTAFRLSGEHNQVNCRECHPTLIFKDAKNQCSGCHSDIHQGTVGLDCARCHTPKSWLVENINDIHRLSRFPLEGAHRTAICSDCHKSESMVRFDVPGVECIDCHRQDYQSSEEPNHVQAGFPEDCSFCHQVNSFQWSESEFTHNQFPLEQGHSSAKCSDCHTTGRYSDVSTTCYQCHQNDYTDTRKPDHNASMLPKDCTTCHTTAKGWKPTLYNHASFPLTFGHATPSCIECHVGGNYVKTDPDCFSCHQPDFTGSTNPNHQAAGFSKVCMTCHTTNPGWVPTTFVHSQFPLELAHSTPECIECHVGDNYTTLKSDCYSCHNKDYTSSSNPNHSAAGFPRACETCHTVNPGWKPANFNHSSFPLTQGHASPLCSDCHKNENFTSTPKECFSCHVNDYQASTDPKHTAAGFSQECLTCHTTAPGWKPATFNHSFFPLTAGHSTPSCSQCHTGDNYTSLSTDCYFCHKEDYSASVNPNHADAKFPVTCQSCHTTNPGWKPSTFTHSIFPLVQGHSTPSCTECHKNGNYTSTPNDCYSCHQTEFKTTANPDHTAAAFSQECQNCHSLNPGWKPTTFSHGYFPLTLGHSLPSCIECHKGENYTGISADCLTCHEPDYISTTNPRHSAAGFTTTCQVCHTANPGWKPSSYNHSSFPLTGSHSLASCNDCHTGDNYTTVPTDCYACHQQDYLSSVNPNHVDAAFPHTCETCHSTNPGWKPTTFSHGTFPLTLGHASATCNDCHIAGNYTSTSSECYSCHNTDFDNSVDPKHSAAGFSNTCQICHTTNPGWKPTSYSHSFFPLTLGHSGPSCNECHTGDNYTTTSSDCYSCHQNNFTATTNPPHVSSGFPHECLICHTTNPGWRPAKYDHTSFPLTLGHSTPACTDCHTGGNYTSTSTDCYSCHQDDYTSSTNPNHTAAAFSQICQTCHTTNPGWQPAIFQQHDNLYFPIYSGNHRGEWSSCTECHTSSSNYKVFTCILCHEHNSKTETDSDHRGENGYTYSGTSCYDCHRNGRSK